uniref:Uncharacterized protein n=1 Tax=Micrurus paraensis TaxID=1970185 RepID=A0A2D4K5U6_9SAUR
MHSPPFFITPISASFLPHFFILPLAYLPSTQAKLQRCQENEDEGKEFFSVSFVSLSTVVNPFLFLYRSLHLLLPSALAGEHYHASQPQQQQVITTRELNADPSRSDGCL